MSKETCKEPYGTGSKELAVHVIQYLRAVYSLILIAPLLVIIIKHCKNNKYNILNKKKLFVIMLIIAIDILVVIDIVME